jgi:hypothetical protein
MRGTKTQDFFLKFGHPQRLPTSPLWSSQRAGSLSTVIHSEWSSRSSSVSTIKSPQRRRQYKLSRVNTILVTPRQPSPSRRMNSQEWRTHGDHRWSAWDEDWVGHSKVRLKSLIGSLDLNEAWRRKVGSSREYLKVFARWNKWPTMLERRGGGLL